MKKARICSVEVDVNKKIFSALLAINGIGKSTSRKIINFLKLNESWKLSDLEEKTDLTFPLLTDKIRHFCEEVIKINIENKLKREQEINRTRLFNIRSRRGMRFEKGLPVNGQQSRANARTTKRLRKRRGKTKRRIY